MMQRTQILLPPELLEQLRRKAYEKKTSVSHVVRSALQKEIQKTEKKKLTAVDAMLEMVKHAYKGKVPKDFSTNDDYLYRLP